MTALDELCERLREARAERDALRAENARLLEMLKLAEADIKVMIGEARPPLSDRLKNVDWDDVAKHYEEEQEGEMAENLKCECGSTIFHGPWPFVPSPYQTVYYVTCALVPEQEDQA
jgi:hypothetical protein